VGEIRVVLIQQGVGWGGVGCSMCWLQCKTCRYCTV